MTTFFIDFENGNDGVVDLKGKVPTYIGGADVTGDVTKFGAGSLSTRGGGSVLTSAAVSFPDSADWHFGSGQFTVESQVTLNALTGGSFCHSIAAQYNGSSGSWLFFITNTGDGFGFGYFNGTTPVYVTVMFPFVLGASYHLAVDRDAANILRLYVDGQVIKSETMAFALLDVTQTLALNNLSANNTTGRLAGVTEETRITKGVARYAGAFTPPAALHPTGAADPHWASTVLLARSFSGMTFTGRWKTITAGATSTRIAPGDEICIMASPEPTPIAQALWTQYSKDVVLPAAVTQMIANCDSAWSVATSVSYLQANTNFKEGVRAAAINIAAAFTTGRAAHFATGLLDLSAYQQVSFWFRVSAAAAAGEYTLRLCSDTGGLTAVHTFTLPAIPAVNSFVPLTFDNGAPLSNAIQSVALYKEIDSGAVNTTIDSIIACKASSAPDSLTLTSLIGKVCNLSWTASTTYAAGDQRKPTQPKRTGYRYQATAGTTGSTEPVWPDELGSSVIDGGVTWTCIDVEDTWYGIQSINGTVVKLDTTVETAGNAGRGYSGATETVATYKREAIRPALMTSAANMHSFQDSGVQGNNIVFKGGWNRTDMSVQSGETWIDGGAGTPTVFNENGKMYLTLENLNTVRAQSGFIGTQLFGHTLKNCHHVNFSSYGIVGNAGGAGPGNNYIGVVAHNGLYGVAPNGNVGIARAISCCANERGIFTSAGHLNFRNARDIVLKNNNGYALLVNGETQGTSRIRGLVTANNTSNVCFFIGELVVTDSSFAEATPFTLSNWRDRYIWSHKHNGLKDAHLGITDGGTIASVTDQRHTASGIAWRFRPTSVNRGPDYPLRLSLGQRLVKANVPVSITIWTHRDNVNIKGQLVVAGGQIAGVPNDVTVLCEPAINGWENSATLTFTPSETGVVEISFRCWDGVGTTNSFWIDDMNVVVGG